VASEAAFLRLSAVVTGLIHGTMRKVNDRAPLSSRRVSLLYYGMPEGWVGEGPVKEEAQERVASAYTGNLG